MTPKTILDVVKELQATRPEAGAEPFYTVSFFNEVWKNFPAIAQSLEIALTALERFNKLYGCGGCNNKGDEHSIFCKALSDIKSISLP